MQTSLYLKKADLWLPEAGGTAGGGGVTGTQKHFVSVAVIFSYVCETLSNYNDRLP